MFKIQTNTIVFHFRETNKCFLTFFLFLINATALYATDFSFPRNTNISNSNSQICPLNDVCYQMEEFFNRCHIIIMLNGQFLHSVNLDVMYI